MKNKQRLINAPTYRQILEQEKKYPGRTQEFIDAIEVAIADLTDMPSMDAVEVVRCKDCKHLECGYKCYRVLGAILSDKTYLLVDEDNFCSYGERREGE